mmetsp:Transcript_148917/g.476944  ORF Transcript_148917/g.476944 Transcript_148917/m.476944 type:complete len:394 (+) Transcript_148917:125-1306(+)
MTLGVLRLDRTVSQMALPDEGPRRWRAATRPHWKDWTSAVSGPTSATPRPAQIGAAPLACTPPSPRPLLPTRRRKLPLRSVDGCWQQPWRRHCRRPRPGARRPREGPADARRPCARACRSPSTSSGCRRCPRASISATRRPGSAGSPAACHGAIPGRPRRSATSRPPAPACPAECSTASTPRRCPEAAVPRPRGRPHLCLRQLRLSLAASPPRPPRRRPAARSRRRGSGRPRATSRTPTPPVRALAPHRRRCWRPLEPVAADAQLRVAPGCSRAVARRASRGAECGAPRPGASPRSQPRRAARCRSSSSGTRTKRLSCALEPPAPSPAGSRLCSRGSEAAPRLRRRRGSGGRRPGRRHGRRAGARGGPGTGAARPRRRPLRARRGSSPTSQQP